jgi:hypothetical protein
MLNKSATLLGVLAMLSVNTMAISVARQMERGVACFGNRN